MKKFEGMEKGAVMAMKDEQGNQDDEVSENTPLEQYDQVRIDREAIETELKGREQFEQRPIPEYYRRPVKRITPEPSRLAPGSKIMTLEIPHQGPRRFGYDLLKHRPADTLTRYQTLCDLEEQAGPSHDHGYLVGSACWLLESELGTLLAAPAKREIGEVLLKHLALKNEKTAAACLEDWLTARKPVTMGTESILLQALRYAVNQQDDQAIAFVERHFREEYRDLLSSSALRASLNKIWSVFRNPVCHGVKIVRPKAYQDFVILCVGTTSIRHWDRYGPERQRSLAGCGVLHLHLTQSKAFPLLNVKDYPKEQPARARIMKLFRKMLDLAPTDTRCHIEFQPHETAKTIRPEDIALQNTPFISEFVSGSTINLLYYCQGLPTPLDMTIFNVDSTGNLRVFVPGEASAEARIFWFPDPSQGERLKLEGSPGMESVFAFATQPGAGFRERVYLDPTQRAHAFSPDETIPLLQRVLAVVESLPKDSWAMGRFEFELAE